MKIVRFILPFLFERNWYTGVWELSRPRLIAFCVVVGIIVLGFLIAFILQLPVQYESTEL